MPSFLALETKRFKINKIDFYLFFAACLLSLIGTLNHELWVDEARSWMIAQTTSFSQMFHITKLEGHPPLWYYFIKLINYIIPHPYSIKVLSFGLSIVSFYFIFVRSHLSLIIKIVLVFNYYLIFEYSSISRSYSLEVFLLTLTCYLFHERTKYVFFIMALSTLLTSTHIYGSIFGISFILLLIKDRFENQNLDAKSKKEFIYGLVFFTVNLLLTVFNLTFGSKEGFVGYQKIDFSIYKLPGILGHIREGFLLLIDHARPVWNDNLPFLDRSPILSSILILAVVALCFNVIRKNKVPAYYFVISFILFLALSSINPANTNSRRLEGHLFLILLSSLLLSRKISISFKNFSHLVLIFSFALHGVAGVIYLTRDFLKPFSNGKLVANYINQPEFNNYYILPETYFYSASYLVYTDKHYYDSDHGENRRFPPLVGKFSVPELDRENSSKRFVISTRLTTIQQRIRENICLNHIPLLLVTNYSFDVQHGLPITIELKEKFLGAIETAENFYVYAITPLVPNNQFCKN